MNKYYIYSLQDPITLEIRYIGKTNNIAKRFSSHLNDKSKSHKASWIKSLKEKDYLPIIKIIKEFDCEKECYLAEIEEIRLYNNLTNHQLGGIGGDSVSMRGKNNHNTILTEDEVLEIKDLLLFTGLSLKSIGDKFNVSIAAIHGITSGNCWAYLTGFTGQEGWIRQESVQNRRKAMIASGLYDRQSKQVSQYDLNNNFIRTFKSISEASKLTNTDRASISQCINNKQKTSNNFIWKKTQ